MFKIFNETEHEIKNMKIINKYTKYVVGKLNIKKCDFNIIFVDDDKIYEINKEYRKISKKTDVITFALEDNDTIKSKKRVLGDVYISLDTAIRQAKEYQHSEIREICFLITHGILHLLGYDHIDKKDEEEMFKLQKELLENYGIQREKKF